MIVATIIFIFTYVLMIGLPKYRSFVALTSAVVFIILRIVPFTEIIGAIDWNVLLILCGTMGTVTFFIESKMPDYLAGGLLRKTPNTMWAVVAMSLFAGFVSAFVDNVATVLMLAPVGLALAKELKISPVNMLIAISVSSNLQGAATLVGDTTSIMLGGHAGMDFIDFFFMDGKFSMFWTVQIGALATVPVICYIFRKEKKRVGNIKTTVVNDYVPTILLLLNIALLVAASLMQIEWELINGFICMAIFAVNMLYSVVIKKNLFMVKKSVKELDYQTLLLLGSLFIIIDGITRVGLIDEIGHLIVDIGGNNLFLMYSIIVWGSVLCSAFIDNIPYVATMLPVVGGISAAMGVSPFLLYFGLLIGATLGGNLTPIGASANIAAIGILRKEGYEVKFTDFFKIGVPFTLVAVLTGYLYVWFVWR